MTLPPMATPALGCGGAVLGVRKQAVVDGPGQAEDKEGGAARLDARELRWVLQRCTPAAIRPLQLL